MNRELEELILAYEAVSASRDKEAEHFLGIFEAQLDDLLKRHRGVSRDILRESIN